MAYKVTIRNSDGCSHVEEGENILAATKRQNVSLPFGCDDGVCGAYIFRIIEGRVEYPGGQLFALAEEDI